MSAQNLTSYRFATAAFVGGSLVPTGGHNPIEPAAAGVPVCFGPHMSNFREIADLKRPNPLHLRQSPWHGPVDRWSR